MLTEEARLALRAAPMRHRRADLWSALGEFKVAARNSNRFTRLLIEDSRELIDEMWRRRHRY
jgi:hypothetical protein